MAPASIAIAGGRSHRPDRRVAVAISGSARGRISLPDCVKSGTKLARKVLARREGLGGGGRGFMPDWKPEEGHICPSHFLPSSR